MRWTLLAITCTWVAFFATGLIVGLCINRADARRIPEHPTLRRNTSTRRLRIVPPVPPGSPDPLLMGTDTRGARPFDWKETEGG